MTQLFCRYYSRSLRQHIWGTRASSCCSTANYVAWSTTIHIFYASMAQWSGKTAETSLSNELRTDKHNICMIKERYRFGVCGGRTGVIPYWGICRAAPSGPFIWDYLVRGIKRCSDAVCRAGSGRHCREVWARRAPRLYTSGARKVGRQYR